MGKVKNKIVALLTVITMVIMFFAGTTLVLPQSANTVYASEPKQNQETASANSYEDYWLLNDTITLPSSDLTGLKFFGSGVAKQTSIIVEDGVMKYSDGKKSVNVYDSNAATKWCKDSTKQLFFDPPVVEGSPLYTWLSANATRYHHYITSSGGTDYCTNAYTSITSSTTSLSAGWYVVDSDVTISSRITCTGAVNLILLNGKTLTASLGITVSGDSNSLTIYGQKGQTGALVATGANYCAGIGGEKKYGGTNITINGGTVTATGGNMAAGIGGGNDGTGSNIEINGGTVTATGGYSGAGIGGGVEAGHGGGSNITINGGTVIASGNGGGSGIGGGAGGVGNNITINGGIVTATGGQTGDGIGNGYRCDTDSSNIYFGDAVVVQAGTSSTLGDDDKVSHPRTDNKLTDVALSFSGKQYVSAHETFQIEYYDASGEGKDMPTDDKYYEIGDDVTISTTTPTRKDYTFLGWATAYDATDVLGKDDKTVKMVDGGVTLYARWSSNSSGDGSGGSGGSGSGSTPGTGIQTNITLGLIISFVTLVCGAVLVIVDKKKKLNK